jgi:hypothetical protein
MVGNHAKAGGELLLHSQKNELIFRKKENPDGCYDNARTFSFSYFYLSRVLLQLVT